MARYSSNNDPFGLRVKTTFTETARHEETPATTSSKKPSKYYVGHIDPAAFLPGLVGNFRKLKALGSFPEIPWKRRAARDMPQEELPLGTEAVAKRRVVRHNLPVLDKPDALWNVGIPHRLRRRRAMLYFAVADRNWKYTLFTGFVFTILTYSLFLR